MSISYQVMDTSPNFLEQMEQNEYETPFEQNIVYNENQVQIMEGKETIEQNLNDVIVEEVAEDINLEDEVSLIKYEEADTVISEKIKEVIFKKETEKTTITILSEQKNIIVDQIKTLQGLRDEVEQEVDQSNIIVEVERDELHRLQRRVLYNEEIVDKLEGIMRTVHDAFGQQKLQNQEILREVADQERKVLELKNWEKIVVQLKSVLNQRSSKEGTSKAIDFKKENLVLKAKLLEKQEYLGKLREQRQYIDSRKETLNCLLLEKQELEGILNDRKIKIKEQNELKDKYSEEIKDSCKKWDVKTEQKTTELSSLLKTAAELKKKLQDMTKEYDRFQNDLNHNEAHKASLEDKQKQILTELQSRQEELQMSSEKQKKDSLVAQYQLKEIESKLITATKENEELKNNLENLKKHYIALLEDKTEKLALKQKLEEKLKADEILSNKVKLLDENISTKQNTVNELSRNLENLSSDNRLQGLEKQKSYALAFTDCLKERYENILQEVNAIRLKHIAMKESHESNKKKIQELETINNNTDLDFDGTERTPSSILKSPSSRKKSPISPKRVKFEGMSWESSGSEAASNSVQQTTTLEKSLNEILEEIHAGTFKKPTKSIKKRKFDID